MNLLQINNIFFVGIGGIGMSALARYFKKLGKDVRGYDKTPSILTNELIENGIQIHYQDDLQLIPSHFLPSDTLVIVTPAVPKDHLQWNYFIDNNFVIKKRAEVLGIITKDTFCFAVAGTHGKTTTSSILGHILFQSGVDVTSFIGGIVENYNSNLIGNGKTVTVVEADEFDRSFLHLHPNIACLTSMDADHLDIYGNDDAIKESFLEFADKIQDKNNFFIAKNLDIPGVTCAINEDAIYKVFNVKIKDNAYQFDIQTPNEIVSDVAFSLPGKHNLSNALLAFAMAYTYGVNTEDIKNALASFKGVRRRFSYQIKTPSVVYIDDYAHHPTEIDAVCQAVRELYPDKKVVVAFQPHLFSRTRDFLDGFANSLSAFDEILLLDIYPARELPIEGIDSELLLGKISNPNRKLIRKEDLINEILISKAEVKLTLGAGDIGEMVHNIKKAINEDI